jgi:hypothetical protein
MGGDWEPPRKIGGGSVILFFIGLALGPYFISMKELTLVKHYFGGIGEWTLYAHHTFD